VLCPGPCQRSSHLVSVSTFSPPELVTSLFRPKLRACLTLCTNSFRATDLDWCIDCLIVGHILLHLKCYSDSRSDLLCVVVSHYMRQLLEAVRYCHDHAIIHCSIQPQFVVLASSGNSSPIKLTGFNAALQLGLSDNVHAGLTLFNVHLIWCVFFEWLGCSIISFYVRQLCWST